MHQPIKYRSDIDGLRALAILPVVFYHAEWWPFTGGYVGVDIFFVISGYLITTIISREMQEGTFSFLSFYERRVRRIIPALFAMLAFCSISAFFMSFPTEYTKFSKNLIATIFFSSNISMWFYSGDYFGGIENINLLLHTWSLSVEEQFYLFFPLFMLFVYWIRRQLISDKKNIKASLLGLCIVYFMIYGVFFVSLYLSILSISSPVMANASFFLLPFRAWELAIGAILALRLIPTLHHQYLREGLAFLGLLFIFIAVLTYTHATPFPGYAALLPCLGAGFIIYAGNGHPTMVGRILSYYPIVFIGLISYSLYLWHWPLIVLARIVNFGDLSVMGGIVAVLISILISVLSWRYIERPFRGKSGLLSRKKLFIVLLLLSSLFISFSVINIAIPVQNYSNIFYNTLLSKDEYLIVNDKIESDKSISWGIETFSKGRSGYIIYKIKYIINDILNGNFLDAFGQAMAPTSSGEFSANKIISIDPQYILIGDSHGMYMTEKTLFNMSGGNISHFYSITDGGRWAISGLRVGDWDISPVIDAITKSKNIKTVIMSGRYALDLYGRTTIDFGPAENGELPAVWIEDETGGTIASDDVVAREEIFSQYFKRTVNRLLDAGKRVVIIYPVPEVGYDVPKELIKRLREGKDVNGFYRPMDYFWKRNRFIISVMDSLGKHPNLVRIKPHEVLCDGHQCKTASDGKPLYVDDDHLSQAGVELLRPQFEAVFKTDG